MNPSLAVEELPRGVDYEGAVRGDVAAGRRRRVGEADASQDDQDHGGEGDQVEGGDDVVGPVHDHDERAEEADGAEGHGHRLVADDEVGVHGRPRAAHDGDEQGEGRVDQVQVDDERDEEGDEVQEHPLPVLLLPLRRRLVVDPFKDASARNQTLFSSSPVPF